MHRGDASELRLESPGRRSLDDLDALDAVDLGLLVHGGQALALALVGGDDEFAALAMRHAVRSAKGVQHPPPAGAVKGAARASRIIEPGMDDLAVARGHPGTD